MGILRLFFLKKPYVSDNDIFRNDTDCYNEYGKNYQKMAEEDRCISWHHLMKVAMATQTKIITLCSETKDFCFLTIRRVYQPFFFKT